MEVFGDAGAGSDCDGVGFEVVVEGFGQAEGVPIGGHVKVGDLACGVNTCVGAPRTLDTLVFFFQYTQGGFDAALDRGEVCLALPADKRFAVVFDFERVSGHLFAIPCVPVFAKSMKLGCATLHMRGDAEGIRLF